MGSKNISITDEAYNALSRERRKGESFTEAIIRLTLRTGKLSDCFGTWEMSDKEKETIFERDLPKARRKSTEILRLIEGEMS